MVNTMVRFENIGMRYGLGPEILRDVTFVLEPGSFTFLTGLSGAGKTTLLKLIYLAEPPSRALITLFGSVTTSTARGRPWACTRTQSGPESTLAPLWTSVSSTSSR